MAEAMQIPPSPMEDNWLDYNYRLAKKIDVDFVRGVETRDILMLLQEVDGSLLSERDIDELKHLAERMSRMDTADKLLDKLKRRKNFFPALLKVLQDPMVKMAHLAELLQRHKDELDKDLREAETRQRHEDSEMAVALPDLLQAPSSEFCLSSNQDDLGDVSGHETKRKTSEHESPEEKERIETEVTDEALTHLYQQSGLSRNGDVFEKVGSGGFCHVCQVSCTSASVEDAHLASSKHLRKAEKAENARQNGLQLLQVQLEKKKKAVVEMKNVDLKGGLQNTPNSENKNVKVSCLMENKDSNSDEAKGKTTGVGASELANLMKDLDIMQTPVQTCVEMAAKPREEGANRDGNLGKGIASCTGESVCSSLDTSLDNELEVEEGKEYETEFVTLKKDGTGECRLCRPKVVFTSFTPAKQHLKGKQHKKNLSSGSEGNLSSINPPTLGPNGQLWDIDSAGKGVCFICNKNLESDDKRESHFIGQTHKKKLDAYNAWKEKNP